MNGRTSFGCGLLDSDNSGHNNHFRKSILKKEVISEVVSKRKSISILIPSYRWHFYLKSEIIEKGDIDNLIKKNNSIKIKYSAKLNYENISYFYKNQLTGKLI